MQHWCGPEVGELECTEQKSNINWDFLLLVGNVGGYRPITDQERSGIQQKAWASLIPGITFMASTNCWNVWVKVVNQIYIYIYLLLCQKVQYLNLCIVYTNRAQISFITYRTAIVKDKYVHAKPIWRMIWSSQNTASQSTVPKKIDHNLTRTNTDLIPKNIICWALKKERRKNPYKWYDKKLVLLCIVIPFIWANQLCNRCHEFHE